MGSSGYQAVHWMRQRSKEQRGGTIALDDGFERSGPTLASSADEHLDDLRIHNRTEDAVESRQSELKPFLAWCSERSLIYPEQITRSMLESYQRHLYHYRKKNGKPLGITTQRSRLGAVKNLFAWLCRKHRLEANPASELELPRPEKRLPVEALSRSEIESILSVPDITDPLGIRDRAVLELFYSSGIRRAELVRLTLSDYNPEKQILWVRLGKGRKDRVVPVGTRARQWIGKYLEEVRPLLVVRAEEPHLFLTGYGDPFNPDVLSRKITDYIKEAGIKRSGSCHLLRHTCATHLLEGGADIRYIQQLLGHEKLETTAIYTAVNITRLQAVHAQCHPAENKA